MADLPTSRIGRFARLAALGTRAGAGRIASAIGVAGGETAIAEAAAETLGTMRGLALKIGQMASYVDGFVPAEHRALYEKTMRSLRDAAPTMTAEAAARVVQSELGAPPESLFAEWSRDAFASASIGQVHHARLEDGRDVAVKVQYEGVDRAVVADLANAKTMTSLAGPFGSKFKLKEQVAELYARFTEELDYEHEATMQSRFSAAFEGDASVRIPTVVAECSSRRVLTTELARGLSFDEACARPEAERAAWAATLWRFVFGSLLNHGLFNADPHPGNYIFGEDGAVWFLDFGCTRVVSSERVAQIRATHTAALSGDEDVFVERARAMLEMRQTGEGARLARPYILLCFAPIRGAGPYRITREYTGQLFDDMGANARAMALGSRKEFSPLPAEWLFFNRLQMGFYSVLARLDVEVDYGAIERELLSNQ